ncbi:MAG: septum formation inhibitor Maf [Burkholderiaceae bacterium]|nr:septum formation inhibitor Maf [Burkholderiaceae bacterium]
MTESTLYLASASPRRHEILQQLGISHQVLDVPAPDGEDEPQLENETPADYVQRTAREKAIRATQWLSQIPMDADGPAAHHNDLVLAADTTVVLAGQIMGKPQDQAQAASMLRQLSGQTHHVHTAIVLAHQGRLLEQVSITEVKFSVLSDDDINAYCRSGEPMGKAGAYGIQGRAAAFIESISGSYTGVMGLPAFETCQLLKIVQASH